ncbi:MAG TPA: hypothetical protein VNA19_00195 [Pyrinomonadaceae bacterium]|jgi:hypothetical protein|nr:hypothetical protein [Pyrinomonadaceae bacterium]
MENVINDPRQATPEWLTGVLRRSVLLNRGEVIRVENRLTKRLPLSVVSRLAVVYSDDAPAFAPSRLFLKISGKDLAQVTLAEPYSREVEFYRTISGAMHDPPFIRCYGAAYSHASGNGYVLLDDLSDTHFQPEAPLPPAPEHCEAAVECLAQLHAFWWEHPRLGNDVGRLFDESDLRNFIGDVEKNVAGFVDFLQDDLPVERRKIYERLISSAGKVWGRLTQARGLTVTHGDAHWWNLLYPRESSGERVRLFDWHLWHVDVGARDLAFMIALGWYPERRAALERRLVRRYHESLLAHGVGNYTWSDCWNDYRWAAIRNLNIPVIFWSQGRSASLWRDNLERAMLAYQDLECAELLDD